MEFGLDAVESPVHLRLVQPHGGEGLMASNSVVCPQAGASWQALLPQACGRANHRPALTSVAAPGTASC
jgi:hypothetical protein